MRVFFSGLRRKIIEKRPSKNRNVKGEERRKAGKKEEEKKKKKKRSQCLSCSVASAVTALPAVSSHAQVYKCRHHQTQRNQLRRQQDNCRQKPHPVASKGFHQLIAILSTTLKVVLKLAAWCAGRPTVDEGVVRFGVRRAIFLVILSFVVVIVVTLRLCFFPVGWSRIGEPSTGTREAASLATTSAGTAKVEARPSGEASGAGEAASTTGEASRTESAASETTLIAHHAEEDLRVDATHATAHAAGAEHVSRVDEVVAIVIAGSLSARRVSTSSSLKIRKRQKRTEGRLASRRLPAYP
jgi:hypothetical protein